MSNFILSCTTCATRMPGWDEVLACFKFAPKAGFKYWGIAGPFLWTPGMPRWLDTNKLKRMASEVGLVGLTEVYGPGFPTDSVAAAEKHAEAVALNFDVAEAMDCPYTVISGGARKEDDSGLKATIAGIKKLLTLVKNKPVKLALEPHYGCQVMKMEDFDTILGAIGDEKLGVTIDTGHFHAAGVDNIAFVKKYPDRVYNVHFKDHIGRQSVEIGKGEIDLKGFVQALHDADYDGALGLELEVKDPENLPQYCADAYVIMKDLVAQVT